MYGLRLIKDISQFSIRPIKLNFLVVNINKQKITNKSYCNYLAFKKEIERDVLLFKYEKPKFFFMVNTLSLIQGIFWSYLGYFLLKEVSKQEAYSKSALWNWLYDKQMKYKNILGCGGIFLGILMVFVTFFYTSRSIRYLTLNKGGKYLTIETYKIPGFQNKFKVPLNQITANYTRKDSKGYITLQIKNKWFYYIIDKKGEFNNPSLFDCTAGIQRNFS